MLYITLHPILQITYIPGYVFSIHCYIDFAETDTTSYIHYYINYHNEVQNMIYIYIYNYIIAIHVLITPM